jgi:hypothetical protein
MKYAQQLTIQNTDEYTTSACYRLLLQRYKTVLND